MNTTPNYGQRGFGDDARKLANLTDDLLFGDIWERSELSKRDRSLITVAALVALYRVEQLPFHLDFALKNGVTREDLVETITHLAFYAGWPARRLGDRATAVGSTRQERESLELCRTPGFP